HLFDGNLLFFGCNLQQAKIGMRATAEQVTAATGTTGLALQGLLAQEEAREVTGQPQLAAAGQARQQPAMPEALLRMQCTQLFEQLAMPGQQGIVVDGLVVHVGIVNRRRSASTCRIAAATSGTGSAASISAWVCGERRASITKASRTR